jgi:hypothetical protein
MSLAPELIDLLLDSSLTNMRHHHLGGARAAWLRAPEPRAASPSGLSVSDLPTP